MERGVKNLLKLAKKVVKKETYSKLKKIGDEKELTDALKYVLISSLEAEHHRLEKQIQFMEELNKDVFIVKNKSLLIPSKILHFKVEFKELDFQKIMALFEEIKKEIKYV